MQSADIGMLIRDSAAELVRLQQRLHGALKVRDQNAETLAVWRSAAAEFRTRYDLLAFRGGYEGALDRINAGDAYAIEAGLCFLEARPYFFRSGYMYKDLFRRLRRAALSESQTFRYLSVEAKLEAWKAKR